MTTVAEFLGAAPASRSERPLGPGEDGSWHFELGKDVHGAFGGVFGGAVAAACVTAARPAAPGRRSFSLHVTFVRALATPTCDARVEVVNAGRTITTVAVDLHDADAKLAARSTVTFAAPEALSPQDHAGRVGVPEFAPVADGTPIRMAGAGNPPIVEVMEPRMVGEPSGGYAHAVRIPWDPDLGSTAEAACMAADFCVGVPVGAALAQFVPMPNPDLSLRFLGDDASPTLVGVGRLAGIDAGIAGTHVEVWNESGVLLAIGLSSTVLLGGQGPSGPSERETG